MSSHLGLSFPLGSLGLSDRFSLLLGNGRISKQAKPKDGDGDLQISKVDIIEQLHTDYAFEVYLVIVFLILSSSWS
ncbi:uncharacterized protein RAG0_02323 [Rhynchosporium agropyri]|uniref:Uncharacterized protein n=1 Tax=Rhynchosporium agropyri TaxID=914238 RepID=A0A1E1K1A8_9HELO|nr:uncharacterized protein RAG0_02323 [Rhynchosporium agropyri]